MAILNQIQDRSQLNRVLQTRLNITGEAPAPGVAPELFPSFVYESDRPEWRYFKNEQYFSEMFSGSAVAAERGVVYITVPSGFVAVFEQVTISTQNVDVGFALQPTLTLPIAVGNLLSRDNRFGSNGVLFAQAASATVANAPFIASRFERMLSATEPTVRYPIILGRTASGLMFRGTSDNTAFNVILRGYTRQLMANEIVG